MRAGGGGMARTDNPPAFIRSASSSWTRETALLLQTTMNATAASLANLLYGDAALYRSVDSGHPLEE